MKLIARNTAYTFEIQKDLPDVGFYLYVFDRQGNCISDHLQDTEEAAKEFAEQEYSIPLSSWSSIV